LATALDLEINFLNTANIHVMDLSETIIGNFIKDDADKFVIATEGAVWDNQETGKRGFNNTVSNLHKALDQSIRRLKVNHLAFIIFIAAPQTLKLNRYWTTFLALSLRVKLVVSAFLKYHPSLCGGPVR
jgi:aryl-alcohol dehydrogenase-like predicted oxidoreductase